MNRRVEALLSGVVTVCAIAVAVTVVYRQLATGPPHPVAREPTYVDRWDQLRGGGTKLGRASAPLQIVEFGDFECPYCRVFHDVVQDIMAGSPDLVALTYYHYPLSRHRYAEAAARAAECAAAQGRFADMAGELLAGQDSLGLRSWTSYARLAGVPDTVRLALCMEDSSTKGRIEAHRALAAQLAVGGTPTVIINGWRWAVPPTAGELRHIAREVEAGRSPFPRRRE